MTYLDSAALSPALDVTQETAVAAKPTVARSDLRRVRFAAGMTLALVIVDLALYVPRLI